MREDDSLFALSHMMEKGIDGPKSIKRRRGPYKSRQKELARQRAEEAAANVMRHRIQENERRYPQIFATVRSPGFLVWYEGLTGKPWDPMYETDIEEMRFRVLTASGIEQARTIHGQDANPG